MPLLNYRTKIWTKITQHKNQEADGQKQTKGIANTDKKKLSGQFFARTIFFVRTIFLSGQIFCRDNFFVRTFFLSGQKGMKHQVEFCQLLCCPCCPFFLALLYVGAVYPQI